MRGTNDLGRQSPAYAVVNTTRHIIVLGSGIEIERAAVIPVAHDSKSIKQQRIMLLCNNAHDVGERRDVEHGIGAWAVLHVHEDDIGAGVLDRADTVVETGAEVLGG